MLALADMHKVVDLAEVRAQLTGPILAIVLTPGAKLSPEVADRSVELFLRSRIPWSEG